MDFAALVTQFDQWLSGNFALIAHLWAQYAPHDIFNQWPGA